MFSTRAQSFFAMLLLAAAVSGNTSQAGVILGILPNPTTTAGVAVSTRSGAGTWHLYAIEDALSTDFGISSYAITLNGTTAINHRSPNGSAIDSNGDPQTWGFTGLRSGTNANPIVASQALPGTSPFLITGFGREASNAATKITAIDPGATGITANSGASWGNYPSLAGTSFSSIETSTGHKWMFIAEGTGNISVASVSSAIFTVYSNAQGTSVQTPVTGLLSCLGLGCYVPPIVSSTVINNVNANDPGSAMYTFSATSPSQPVSWGGFSFVSGPTPTVPATFDPATHIFNWNTVSSPIGSYKWSVDATNIYGTGTGFVTVNITTVPEPAAWSLTGLGLLGRLCFIRRRSFPRNGMI